MLFKVNLKYDQNDQPCAIVSSKRSDFDEFEVIAIHNLWKPAPDALRKIAHSALKSCYDKGAYKIIVENHWLPIDQKNFITNPSLIETDIGIQKYFEEKECIAVVDPLSQPSDDKWYRIWLDYHCSLIHDENEPSKPKLFNLVEARSFINNNIIWTNQHGYCVRIIDQHNQTFEVFHNNQLIYENIPRFE